MGSKLQITFLNLLERLAMRLRNMAGYELVQGLRLKHADRSSLIGLHSFQTISIVIQIPRHTADQFIFQTFSAEELSDRSSKKLMQMSYLI